MKPYLNISETDEEILRIFGEDVDPTELKWHRDRETRTVISLEPTDWMIQLENGFPRRIDKVRIPAGEWHRVIKGTGELRIKIIKHEV